MGLKVECIYNRLKTLLAYHDKLREENREKGKMDRTARKIKHLVFLLERYNSKKLERAALDE